MVGAVSEFAGEIASPPPRPAASRNDSGADFKGCHCVEARAPRGEMARGVIAGSPGRRSRAMARAVIAGSPGRRSRAMARAVIAGSPGRRSRAMAGAVIAGSPARRSRAMARAVIAKAPGPPEAGRATRQSPPPRQPDKGETRYRLRSVSDDRDRGALLAVLLERRILVLDGATGTALAAHDLGAEDYGGEALIGCHEALVLHRPDVVPALHRGYLAAGADIVETDTFGGTPVVLAEYGLADRAAEINRRAAELARQACAEADRRRPWASPLRGRLDGPDHQGAHAHRRHHLRRVAARPTTIQVEGLADGGADVLLIETSPGRPQPEGGADRLPRRRAPPAGGGVGHHRTHRDDPGRPDHRGGGGDGRAVATAVGRDQLLHRTGADDRARPRPCGAHAVLRGGGPQRRHPRRRGPLPRDARRAGARAGALRRRGVGQPARRLLRHHARSTSARLASRRRGPPPRQAPAYDPARMAGGEPVGAGAAARASARRRAHQRARLAQVQGAGRRRSASPRPPRSAAARCAAAPRSSTSASPTPRPTRRRA